MKIKTLRFPTSVYAALELGKKLYIGGSNWNRRKIKYSKKIAKQAKGVLYISENNKIIKKVFPSMIYSLSFLGNKIFVGCKSEKKALNIIDLKGNLIKQTDDKIGKGIYNSAYNKKKNEILLATRQGILKIIDANSLKLKKKFKLTKARLWPLKLNQKRQIVYTGDYDGILYIIHNSKILKFDLKSLYKNDKRLRKGFAPSLWGLEIIKDKIVMGTRWGDIIISNKNLSIQKIINLGEDVSCIEKFSKNIALVGTRYGKLFSFNLNSYKLLKIIEIKPALQKENAIWSMSSSKKHILVCFADGNVLRIEKARFC
ncbi:hypothetical protein HZA33_03705 [Candidatus Pacearchaeota archaeon]|nr:hypothetical protein [Candidatus Pacearchaeota archaeon]